MVLNMKPNIRSNIRRLALVCSAAFALSVSAATYAEGTDSTSMTMVAANPVSGKTVIDTSRCYDTNNINAGFGLNNGSTLGEKTITCQEGYVPYGFKSNVLIIEGTGVFQWKYYCCKLGVKYSA